MPVAESWSRDQTLPFHFPTTSAIVRYWHLPVRENITNTDVPVFHKETEQIAADQQLFWALWADAKQINQR